MNELVIAQMLSCRTTIWVLVTVGATCFVSCAEAPSSLESNVLNADGSGQGNEIYAKADDFRSAGRYDSAHVYFQKASIFFEQEEDWEKYVSSLNGVIESLWREYNLSDAEELSSEVLVTGLEKLGTQHPVIAKTHRNIGIIQYQSGNFDKALEQFHLVLNIRLSTYDSLHPDVTSSYYDLSNVYWSFKDLDQSLAFRRKALDGWLRELGDEHPRVAGAYNGVGQIYAERGEEQVALSFFEKALNIRLSLYKEPHPDVAVTYNEIGKANLALGKYNEAVAAFEEALDIWNQIHEGNHPAIAIAVKNLGDAYSLGGFFEEALDNYYLALEARIEVLGENHPEVATLYGKHLSEVYAKLGNIESAFRYAQKDISIKEQFYGEDSPRVLNSYMRMGNLYFNEGDYNTAIKYYDHALTANGANLGQDLHALSDSVLYKDSLLEALQAKGAALYQKYILDESDLSVLLNAHEIHMICAEYVDAFRSKLEADNPKYSFVERHAALYDDAILTALLLHRVTGEEIYQHRAFVLSEKGKSGALRDALVSTRARKFAYVPDSLVFQTERVQNQLLFYERNLAEERIKDSGADSEKILQLQNRVYDLTQEYNSIIGLLEESYPKYYDLKYSVGDVSVDEAVNALSKSRTTLVDYHIGKSHIVIFTINDNGLHHSVIEKPNDLEKLIDQFRMSINDNNGRGNYSTYVREAYRLHSLLISPVEDELIHSNHLVIIPSGLLHGLPFSVLLTREVPSGTFTSYGDLEYLIDDYEVSYTNSTSIYINKNDYYKENIPTKDLIAFAPVFPDGIQTNTRSGSIYYENYGMIWNSNGYLPHTSQEVRDILNLFHRNYSIFDRFIGNRSKVYTYGDAKESAIPKQHLSKYKYIHFATHAFANEDEPLLSGLLFSAESPGSEHDGVLDLSEVYSLNLNADLVALSACETGRGQLIRGEGIIGLTRGFLYAGAQNVLMTLHQVSDSQTHRIMVSFYEALLQGQTKSQALRSARLEIRREPGSRPNDWAWLVLIGRN